MDYLKLDQDAVDSVRDSILNVLQDGPAGDILKPSAFTEIINLTLLFVFSGKENNASDSNDPLHADMPFVVVNDDSQSPYLFIPYGDELNVKVPIFDIIENCDDPDEMEVLSRHLRAMSDKIDKKLAK